jgi:hypothetical protein
MCSNRQTVDAVKIKPSGKWHRIDIFDSEVTLCGLNIPSIAHSTATFSIEAVAVEPGWIPKQHCLKCFTYNAIDFVIDSLSRESARSLSSINNDCYKDSYIHRILSRLVRTKIAHICYVDSRTHANLYRFGDKASCPLKEKWHTEKDANIAWMESIVNRPWFWLRPALASPLSLPPV